MRLHSPHCPRCGAEVTLDASKQRATCAYCGTTSYVESARPRNDAPVVVVKTHVVTALALGVSLLALLVASVVLLRGAPPPVAPPSPTPRPFVRAPTLESTPAPPSAPSVQATLHVTGLVPARLSDVDGDRIPELVVSVRVDQPGARTATEVAIFDAAEGTLRARTSALDDFALAAVWRTRLVLAASSGQLTAYDLGSGDQQWSTALGERVAALCEPPSSQPDTLLVVTDDGRALSLDLTTGRQQQTKAQCQIPLAIADGRRSPRDRRDLTAPSGVEAYACGGVRVLSAGYAVPDACQARAGIPSDRLAGMVGHRIWRHGAGWLIFGVRQPGTYVPTVGLYERGRFRWKLEVPLQNPLEIDEGGPAHVALRDRQLALSYASSKTGHGHVTMLDTSDGRRLWTRDLGAKTASVVALQLGLQSVVVQTDDDLILLAREDGQIRKHLSGLTLSSP